MRIVCQFYDGCLKTTRCNAISRQGIWPDDSFPPGVSVLRTALGMSREMLRRGHAFSLVLAPRSKESGPEIDDMAASRQSETYMALCNKGTRETSGKRYHLRQLNNGMMRVKASVVLSFTTPKTPEINSGKRAFSPP